jgi:hypothetical protein
MKKPNVIRFRCHCFECSGDTDKANDRSRFDTVETDQNNTKSGEDDPRLMQDVIGKLLFGA